MAIINKEYLGRDSPYVVIENGYSDNLQSVDPVQEQGENALWNYNVSQGSLHTSVMHINISIFS
jgi:hypothetical protein